MINKYPYTNFHELNLDWIVSKIGDIDQAVTDTEQNANNAATSAGEAVASATASANSATASANSADEAAMSVTSVAELKEQIEEVADSIGMFYNAPLVAEYAAQMTETDKIYVYVGNETGYVNGNWYYYNGTNWISGGVFNATALATDKTLTIRDSAADSKQAGLFINAIIDELQAKIQYADRSDVNQNGKYYNIDNNNNIVLATGSGYTALNKVYNLSAGTYNYMGLYDAFTILENVQDGTLTKLSAISGHNGSNNTARTIDITFDFNVYITIQPASSTITYFTKGKAPTTNKTGIIQSIINNAIKTNSEYVRESNYQTLLPDLDNAVKNTAYILLFANHATNIPANYPTNGFIGTENIFIDYSSGAELARAQVLITENGIYYRRRASSTSWINWLNITGGSVTVTVAADGSGDFTRFIDGLDYATTFKNATLYVKPGVYDLYQEYGDDFFNAIDGSDQRVGPQITNNVRIIGTPQTIITCNYTGTNTHAAECFSMINTSYSNCYLNNLTFIGSNIRYIVHDEHTNNATPYTTEIVNCNMELDNSNNIAGWTQEQIIGGGLGACGTILIHDCQFNSEHANPQAGTVSYHNSSAENALSVINIFNNKFVGVNNTARFGWYGPSINITECNVYNNLLGTAPIIRAENSSANVVNMKLTAWNNTLNI